MGIDGTKRGETSIFSKKKKKGTTERKHKKSFIPVWFPVVKMTLAKRHASYVTSLLTLKEKLHFSKTIVVI